MDVGQHKPGEAKWRVELRRTVQVSIFPNEPSWLPDDMDLSDVQWIPLLLEVINRRFTIANTELTSDSRLQILKTLVTLPCAIAHPDHVNCTEAGGRPGVSLIPTYLTVLSTLLNGPESEINCLVWRYSSNALTQALRHHTLGFGEKNLEAVREIISKALQSTDRSTRLASGRSFVELFRLYETLGRGATKRVQPLLDMLYVLLRNPDDAVIETTLITAGLIGRLPDTEIIGCIILCLISQFERSSIILRGIVYTQLLAMVKHHKKSPYSLLAPYIPQIAPFIVAKLCRHPNLLLETCRFLSLPPGDFLQITLTHTLPKLFGDSKLDVLEKISNELGKKVSAMFLNASADILAHIYMLTTSSETDRAMKFILFVLTEAAKNAEIRLANVVKSCIVPLLVHLVLAMGDKDDLRAKRAIDAIRKVEHSLASDEHSGVSSHPHLGNFLKTYLLGIIAYMNEKLQDMRGKTNPESKQQVLRGLQALIGQIGPSICNVAPQIMATLQTAISIAYLSDVAIECWRTFLTTLDVRDLGPHVGPTSAAFVDAWPQLSPRGREVSKATMEYIVLETASELGPHLDEIVDLSNITELASCTSRMQIMRHDVSTTQKLTTILERTHSDNVTVVSQSLQELKAFTRGQPENFIRDLASGDVFDPLVGQLMKTLLSVACRDGEGTEYLRLLAFECIGALGAVDPDRFDIPYHDKRMVVRSNFTDEEESIEFALHLIKDNLVHTFRSTSDTKFQSHLAYAIQELLKFCKFTPDLVLEGSPNPIPLKVRNRWNALPKHVLETVTPLLGSKFTVTLKQGSEVIYSIYLTQSTYREWIQVWTGDLIAKVTVPQAKTIFNVFRSAVRNKDVGVAHDILPHLILSILISGLAEDADLIRMEIIAVLRDQVNATSMSSSDKRLLSAQAIFTLMDHLNKWVRLIRQEIMSRRADNKRPSRHHSDSSDAEEKLARVDSVLGSIDQDLVAKAAFECKAYARSLMNFEKRTVALKANDTSNGNLQVYYDRLHEIYAHLDEPDGMEGVSTYITSPSLEHHIRQHESTGRWTAAQSCWEVRLQQAPDKLEYHLGLLRCLRNLGHYDTLRTHIRGVLTRNPKWKDALTGFHVEAAWMVNDWEAVQKVVTDCRTETDEIAVGRVLLAMRSSDEKAIVDACSIARAQLGAPITAAGERGYRRAYNAMLNLHAVHDLEVIHSSASRLREGLRNKDVMPTLTKVLASRLESTLPTFRTREPILSLHRSAFSLSSTDLPPFKRAIGQAWLVSSKIARKAGHWQTAYNAVLQAQEGETPHAFFQSAKLVKAAGEPLRALRELNNALMGEDSRRKSMAAQGIINLAETVPEDAETKRARLLRARWMRESERYDSGVVIKELSRLAKSLSGYESAQFHAGHFQDECYKLLSHNDKKSRGHRMNLQTVKYYAAANRIGSKYVYQTIPRMLTLWLDMGEDDALRQSDDFKAINTEIEASIKYTPIYKWLTAFPQIVSRVDHPNDDVYAVLSRLITTVLNEYPHQGLWLFISVIKSTKKRRLEQGRKILDQLKNNPQNARTAVPVLVSQSIMMSSELLDLCNYQVKDDTKTLSMARAFPRLLKLAPSPLIIPLQESLVANLPSTSSGESDHQPFPPDCPTIANFHDDIAVMRTLAKPRRISIRGSNGLLYMFLGKPKDDLRKDARLMDFNSIINKLLKTNSESRRRQLRIRTYSVVTLNEECGFIEWVPHTIPIRPILIKYYAARGIEPFPKEVGVTFGRIKEVSDKDAAKLFKDKVLTIIPPVFHEWFIETFPEPSAWLSSRLSYGRTAAVMSMVGFILGLGDRHFENILLDINSGEVIHVDFNCLFEKGKTLETPERVPFRLTNNVVDGLGVTGVEGVFRIASEITMQLLRDNKDVLMSVLDAFIHDPLVEWEDIWRKTERRSRPDRNASNDVKGSVDLRKLAKNALDPIERKLRGLYFKDSNKYEKREKETSTTNLVQMLIEEATDLKNLAKMYPGWAPHH
ncbi:hypothetical protein BD410DRAFT_710460 [Rickenella mellea]|uniref:non-specific serine/threonine protein kinase n=1 Tax=Rickenella mellea TaxID=50990 RepID=A0A4R5XFJ4_9AGAM|nr:hypothetical protein BD410DRAFT_710460 [Rickenella mellea]